MRFLLKGPYRIEVNGITDGSQPGTKQVAFRWDIDWDKASDDLKACIPRFELSGNEVALFQLDNNNWRFVSYLNPEELEIRFVSEPRRDSGSAAAGWRSRPHSGGQLTSGALAEGGLQPNARTRKPAWTSAAACSRSETAQAASETQPRPLAPDPWPRRAKLAQTGLKQ